MQVILLSRSVCHLRFTVGMGFRYLGKTLNPHFIFRAEQNPLPKPILQNPRRFVSLPRFTLFHVSQPVDVPCGYVFLWHALLSVLTRRLSLPCSRCLESYNVLCTWLAAYPLTVSKTRALLSWLSCVMFLVPIRSPVCVSFVPVCQCFQVDFAKSNAKVILKYKVISVLFCFLTFIYYICINMCIFLV